MPAASPVSFAWEGNRAYNESETHLDRLPIGVSRCDLFIKGIDQGCELGALLKIHVLLQF